jgi:8-amino-7-oxononanoate synthase
LKVLTRIRHQAQENVQNVVKLFLQKVTSIPVWDRAESIGLLRIPLYAEGWGSLPFVTQIVPIWTRPRHSFYLAVHLQMFGFSAYPIDFPVVPKGTERVRLMFHAANTADEVEALVASIGVWAEEMLEIEKGGDGVRLPTAARQAFALMAKEGLSKSA